MGESRAASTAAGSSPASLLAVQPELETTLADGPTTLTGAQADGHAPPAGIQTNFILRTTSRWSEWSQDKTKQAYAIAKKYASRICDTVKNAAKAVNNTTKQACDKVRGTSPTKLPEIPTDDQTTPSCETQCVGGIPNAAGVLAHRRLQTSSEWSKDKTKQAYDIAKKYAPGAWKAAKNTTCTKQVCDKVRGTSQTKLPEIPTDDQMTPSCETQCVDGKSSAAAAALKRRRLQNRPKSHVVVLERLLEEIRESERNCK